MEYIIILNITIKVKYPNIKNTTAYRNYLCINISKVTSSATDIL